MKKTAKIFSVLMTLCLLCGIVALAVSAATPSANTAQSLQLPVVKDGDVLISGNYAANDGTSATGWASANGAGTNLTTNDVSKGYMNFRQNLSKTTTTTLKPYIEWNLSAGNHDTAGMYKMNLRDYGYAVYDFDYGTDSNRVQIGYHVHYPYAVTVNKVTTNYAKIEPMYKTYIGDISDADLQKAVEDNYTKLQADLATYAGKFEAGVNTNAADYVWTLDKAKDSKTLAFSDGMYTYIIMRSMSELGLETYDKNKLKTHYVYLYTTYNSADGSWYLTNASTYKGSTASVKINGVNDFKHVTVVEKTVSATDTTAVYQFAVYVDGVFMFEKTISGENALGLYLDSMRVDIPIDAMRSDMYSLAFDNLTVNYYAKGYSTAADVLGVDDLFNENNKTIRDIRLYDLTDTVYNKNFKTLNGSVTIGDEVYNVPSLAYAAIAKLEKNATISSTMALFNVEVSDKLESLTINTTEKVTFSEASLEGRVVDVTADKVVLRAPGAADKYTINWLDAGGKVITSTEQIRDHMPVSELNLAIAADYVDTKTGVLYDTTITGWKLVIDGKNVDLRALALAESTANKVVNAIPVCEEFDSSKTLLYYIGIYDEVNKIVRPAYGRYGNYNNYTNIAQIDDEFNAAASGSTLVLLSDVNIRATGNYTVAAGKTLSYDLNGHIMDCSSGSKANSNVVFNLNEGATINVYSSVEGASIFHATPYTVTSNGAYTDYQVHAQGGFINYPDKIDGATANIGAFRGYAANLEYNGGCLAYSQGYDFNKTTTTVERGHFVGGAQRILNINGGQYYFFARPPYGAIVTHGPDFVVTANGAKFYGAHGSYGIFHDYGSSTGSSKDQNDPNQTSRPRFDVCSTFTLNNCEIIGLNVDGESYTLPNKTAPIAGNKGAWVKVFYEIAKDSNVYINNTKIVGQLYYNLNGKIHLGEGNVIATNSDISKLDVLDGVNAIIPSTTAAEANIGNLSLSITHAPAYNNFDVWFDVDGTTYTIKSSVFDRNNYVTATAEKPISIITLSDDVLKEYDGKIVPITWLNENGGVYKVTYEAVGNEIDLLPTDHFTKKVLNNGWFDVGYSSWTNITAGEDANSFIAVAGKENKLSPKGGLLGSIAGAKARFSISTIEYTPILYIPKPASDSGIIFNPTAAGDVTGFYFGTTRSGGAEFGIDGKTYHSYSTYLGHSEAARIIKVVFIVEKYDLNGDGSFSEDEYNLQVTDEFLLSPAIYAKAILEQHKHGSDETNLAYAMMQYDNEFSKYLNVDGDTARIAEFFAAYDASCTCEGDKCQHINYLDEIEYENTVVDFSKLQKYAYGATFNITKASKPRTVIYLYPLAEGESYTVSVSIPSYGDGGKLTNVPYSASRRTANDIKVKIDDKDVTLWAYYFNPPLSDITNMMNITITHTASDGTKTTVNGTYSLAAYIEDLGSIDVAKSLYALSLAVKDYKLITRDELEQQQ